MTTTHGTLVGVTGPGENTAALRYAAERSARTGSRVTLVHVVNHLLTPPPPSVLIASEPMTEVGRRLLDETVAEYGRISDHQHCESILLSGGPAGALLDLSRDAELVVVAHRQLSPLRRVVTWSNATRLAAHAYCPVVAVPTSWPDAPDGAEAGWVTIGVHETGAPTSVLHAGFAAAEQQHQPLRLLHAWRLDPVYDDTVAARVDPEWRARVAEEIADATAPIAKEYPDVEVEVLVEFEFAGEALAHAATNSSLLVLGRHGRHSPAPERLGSLARTMFREASCPVMVVPV